MTYTSEQIINVLEYKHQQSPLIKQIIKLLKEGSSIEAVGHSLLILLLKALWSLNNNEEFNVNVSLENIDEDIYGRAIYDTVTFDKTILVNKRKSPTFFTDLIIAAHELAHLQTMSFEENNEHFLHAFKQNSEFINNLFEIVDFNYLIDFKGGILNA